MVEAYISHPFGLSLSKPYSERSEDASLRSAAPFDFAQGERSFY